MVSVDVRIAYIPHWFLHFFSRDVVMKYYEWVGNADPQEDGFFASKRSILKVLDEKAFAEYQSLPPSPEDMLGVHPETGLWACFERAKNAVESAKGTLSWCVHLSLFDHLYTKSSIFQAVNHQFIALTDNRTPFDSSQIFQNTSPTGISLLSVASSPGVLHDWHKVLTAKSTHMVPIVLNSVAPRSLHGPSAH